MDFMDLDDDLDTDPIKDFLNSKLEEIKNKNTKLHEILEELEAEAGKIASEVPDFSRKILIEKSWIKIIHDKYAVWFSIKNKTTRILKNCRLILHWNSEREISYKILIYKIPKNDFTKNFEQIDCINDEASIVAVINYPEFLTQLQYKINGLFSFSLNDIEHTVEIPEISLESQDSTNRQKIVPIYKLIEFNIPDFVSCLACSYNIKLIMKLLDERDIYSVFEIDAALYRMDFDKNNHVKYFLCHKISPIFDGCIIEITDKQSDISKISIYYRDEDSLIAFIHHLYQNIKSIILLPEYFEDRFHSKSVEDCEKQLKNCLLKEVKFVKEFEKYFQSSNLSKIKDFKLELCDLEHETDKAYVQLRVAQDRREDDE